MAKQYRKLTDQRDHEKIENLLNQMPDYMRNYEVYLSDRTTTRTQVGYLTDLYNFFRYLSESSVDAAIQLPADISLSVINHLTRDDIEMYMLYLDNYTKNDINRTNGRASKKRKYASISSLFRYLYNTDRISSNIMSKIESPRLPQNRDIVRLDDHEVNALMNVVEKGIRSDKLYQSYHQKLKDRDKAIIALLLGSGIRVSECVGLDIQDVDFRNYAIHVIRKGNKTDEVYFSDEAARYLKDYMIKRKLMEAKQGHEDALFLSIRNTRMSVRTMEQMISEYASVAVPYKEIAPHRLRATFATNYYHETGDIAMTATVLGHSGLEVARRRYASIDRDKIKANRNAVDRTSDL